jgi:hypothetical protein
MLIRLKLGGCPKTWLMSYDFHGLPIYVLASKLKALKADLKKWNEVVFGDVGKKKKEMLEGIRDLDIIAKGRCLVEEWVRKLDMSKELEKSLLLEQVN